MKFFQYSLTCFFFLSIFSHADEYDLFLCIGQSNMSGRGEMNDKHKKEIKHAYILNTKGEWSPAKAPFNAYSTVRKDLKIQGVNPVYSFAHALSKFSGKKKIGYVVNARGGTKISQWQPNEELFEEAVKRAKLAQKTGTFKAILWHQGEGNRKSTTYSKSLATMVEALRKELNSPDLLVIVGEIAGEAVVNEQLATFVKETSNTVLVSAKELTMKDKSHFDTAGQIELGKRYAKAYLKAQAGTKAKN